MKIATLSVFAAMAMTLPCFAQAPVGPGAVKLGKIAPSAVKTPEYNLSSGPTKRSRAADWLEIEVDYDTKPDDIDELTFKFTVGFEKKLLDGEVTYVTIAKGREHYAVVYISPKAIEKLTGGKAFTTSSLDNIWVEVSRSGQVLDKASWKNSPLPNLPHVGGMVLNKDETPFAPLFYDRYEAIKKGSR